MPTVNTTTTEPSFGKKIVDGAAWGIGFGVTSFFVGKLLLWATSKSADDDDDWLEDEGMTRGEYREYLKRIQDEKRAEKYGDDE